MSAIRPRPRGKPFLQRMPFIKIVKDAMRKLRKPTNLPAQQDALSAM